MKAFVIAAETVTDGALFDAYRAKVPATLAAFDGKGARGTVVIVDGAA